MFYGPCVQAHFLLGPVGYRRPSRDLETDHSIPKTEGKYGTSEMENVLEKQSNSPPPPPLYPQTCTKGTDNSEVIVKWCATLVALGTLLVSSQLAHINRQYLSVGVQLKYKLLWITTWGTSRNQPEPGERKRSLEAGRFSWEARVTLENSSGQSYRTCLSLVPTVHELSLPLSTKLLPPHLGSSPPIQNSHPTSILTYFPWVWLWL